jgi:hypothetical protein
MRTDRTTEALLALIAITLFMNAIVPLVQPVVVNAQDTARIERFVVQIANGVCLNSKIC